MNLSPLPDTLADEQIKWHCLRMRHELEEIERVDYVRRSHEKMAAGAEYDQAVTEAATEARAWFLANHQAELDGYAVLLERQRVYEQHRNDINVPERGLK